MRLLVASLVFLSLGCASNGDQPFPYFGNDFVHYSEGPCLGSCPPFDVYVFSDGLMLYRGDEPVHPSKEALRLGNYIFDRDQDFFLDLVERLRKEDYQMLLPDYGVTDLSACGTFLTDHPTIAIERVKFNKRTAVLYNTGCSDFDDERKINALIDEMRDMLQVESLVFEGGETSITK